MELGHIRLAGTDGTGRCASVQAIHHAALRVSRVLRRHKQNSLDSNDTPEAVMVRWQLGSHEQGQSAAIAFGSPHIQRFHGLKEVGL